MQTDPQKGASPWARAVVGRRQVLICPACQGSDPAWSSHLDRCVKCGGTRLSVVLGTVVCRDCRAETIVDD